MTAAIALSFVATYDLDGNDSRISGLVTSEPQLSIESVVGEVAPLNVQPALTLPETVEDVARQRVGSLEVFALALIDVPGFITDLKGHASDHGFHVHDERHMVETYSMSQVFEVDLHPELACGGPLDLHLAMEVDPRTLLTFEDAMITLPEDAEPPQGFAFPLIFSWAMPPLVKPPDLLVLATELAGIGGTVLPLEVSAIDSTASATDAPERRLAITSRVPLSLGDLFLERESLCEPFERCREVCEYMLDRSPYWLDQVL